MQKVINFIFKKYEIKNLPGNYIVLKLDGYDDLSIGVLDDNMIYVAYTFNFSGDRAVDPEIILYRYFDIETNQYEIIPFSFESYLGYYKESIEFSTSGAIIIKDKYEIKDASDYIEGMARRIELVGFLDEPSVLEVWKDGH